MANVTVKVFGAADAGAVKIEAASLAQLKKALSLRLNRDYGELCRMKTFLNGTMVYRAKLRDGDEVLFISPSAGG